MEISSKIGSQKAPELPLDLTLVMYGAYMAYACYGHGLCMLHAWVMHITCMGYACCVHGNPDRANHAGNMHDHVTCMVYYACFLHATHMKNVPILCVFQVKYHACLREHAWYMHVLIHYPVSQRTLSGTFHSWNSMPVIVCYVQGTCMFQVLHFEYGS